MRAVEDMGDKIKYGDVFGFPLIETQAAYFPAKVRVHREWQISLV
jgi:hypothetical protein